MEMWRLVELILPLLLAQHFAFNSLDSVDVCAFLAISLSSRSPSVFQLAPSENDYDHHSKAFAPRTHIETRGIDKNQFSVRMAVFGTPVAVSSNAHGHADKFLFFYTSSTDISVPRAANRLTAIVKANVPPSLTLMWYKCDWSHFHLYAIVFGFSGAVFPEENHRWHAERYGKKQICTQSTPHF